MNTDFARRQMVEQQIRTWDVSDPDVLEACASLARDQFVPAGCADVAYADTEIPLPHGECMLRPSIEGKLLQALDLDSEDEVLEIGTGTGYLTACLARLAGQVTSIDIHQDFVGAAESNLEAAEIQNVTLNRMDALKELPSGSFDAIAVTGSLPEMDDRLVEALKPGGRLFVVIGESPAKTALLITLVEDGNVETLSLFETDIPALVNAERPAEFSF